MLFAKSGADPLSMRHCSGGCIIAPFPGDKHDRFYLLMDHIEGQLAFALRTLACSPLGEPRARRRARD